MISKTGRFQSPPAIQRIPTGSQVLRQYRAAYPRMSQYYHENLEGMMQRQSVLDEYKKLHDSIPKEESLLRGMFTRWWGMYRLANPSIYDTREHPRMIAEVRIGLAKCAEAARLRKRAREAREARRKHDWETYGRQHR